MKLPCQARALLEEVLETAEKAPGSSGPQYSVFVISISLRQFLFMTLNPDLHAGRLAVMPASWTSFAI